MSCVQHEWTTGISVEMPEGIASISIGTPAILSSSTLGDTFNMCVVLFRLLPLVCFSATRNCSIPASLPCHLFLHQQAVAVMATKFVATDLSPKALRKKLQRAMRPKLLVKPKLWAARSRQFSRIRRPAKSAPWSSVRVANSETALKRVFDASLKSDARRKAASIFMQVDISPRAYGLVYFLLA